MYVVGIDIGLVNLAFASYNMSSKEVYVDKVSLIENYKYTESVIPFLIQEFIEKRRTLFEKCNLIVIEYQMRRNMVVISHAICSYFLAMGIRTRFVHPRNVRFYFNISCNNYKRNKEASINFIPKLLNADQLSQANLSRFKKKDDCADALILAFYAAKNYSTFDKVEDVKSRSTASRRASRSFTTTARKRKSKAKGKTKKKRKLKVAPSSSVNSKSKVCSKKKKVKTSAKK